VFLYQITVFLQQNTTASLLELYFNDSMQTAYARGGSGGGSQQREVADVVFTDTVLAPWRGGSKNRNPRNPQNLRNPMCIINKNPPSATKSTCM